MFTVALKDSGFLFGPIARHHSFTAQSSSEASEEELGGSNVAGLFRLVLQPQ
jgi:hypothetical protein